MEGGMLGNYCLSEHLLHLFSIICVRNDISCFSVMFPFLTMAMLHLLGLSTWIQIFFLRYKCKRSNITLSQTVKNLAHSNNCPFNNVNPDRKPDEIEDLPFASSGQGLQVRLLGEKWKGCWRMCILDAVLDLQCNVLHWEFPISSPCAASLQEAVSWEGAQQQCRCSW